MEALESRRLLAVTPVTPNDPLLDYRFEKIEMSQAWALTTGSSDVVIAVLDTGVDIAHPDLAANIFTNPGEIAGNGIDDDGNGFVDDVHGWDFVGHDNRTEDTDGHGTHVAGIIGGVGNNGLGVSGIAQNVKILPVKVLGDTGWTALTEGIRYVTALKNSGVNVVAMNASLGGDPFPVPAGLEAALRASTEAGILFIAAAGNESRDIGGPAPVPAKLSLSNPGIITVAATDQNDNLANFSNFNQSVVHVAAPGVDILSTWSADAASGDALNPGDGYNTISGTSMTAPVVSGIAALLASYRPQASMMQLKEAILKGAQRVPSLEPLYSLPGKVQTAGRVNAYNALLWLDNNLVGQDAQTRGNWAGAYGLDGHFIFQDSITLAPDLGFAVEGAFFQPASVRPNNLSGLVSAAAPGARVLTHVATTDTMKLTFNFADDQSHLVTLYMADAERQGRAQVVQLVDLDAGRRMDGAVVANFQNGRYITFEVAQNAQIWVTNVAPGKTAVVDGVFVDRVPTSPRSFLGADGTTVGKWTAGYGSQGALIVGQDVAPPDFVNLSVSGAAATVRQSRSADARALEYVGDKRGVRAYFAAADTMSLDLSFTDARTHAVTLYLADYEKAGRVQRVDVLDRDSGALLDCRLVSDFASGRYLSWELGGNVRLMVSRISGPNAVVSGVFFDAAPSAAVRFVAADAARNGNWYGHYGSAGAVIFGQSGAYPPALTSIGGGPFHRVINPVSSDPRAPLSSLSGLGGRFAGYIAAPTQLTLDLDLGEGAPRRTAFYMVDYERLNRVQRIEVVDPSSGRVLVSQVVGDFAARGKYAVFDLSGRVQVRITRLAGPNVVLSGVFFG